MEGRGSKICQKCVINSPFLRCSDFSTRAYLFTFNENVVKGIVKAASVYEPTLFQGLPYGQKQINNFQVAGNVARTCQITFQYFRV